MQTLKIIEAWAIAVGQHLRIVQGDAALGRLLARRG